MSGISTTQQIIASSTGAMLTSLFTTPLDVVKVRLQSQSAAVFPGDVSPRPSAADMAARNLGRARKPRFTGTLGLGTVRAYALGTSLVSFLRPAGALLTDTLLKVARQEGIVTLWAGLPPTLVMTVPATVLYFSTYEQLKMKLRRTRYKDYAIVPIFAGAVARICAVSVISPIELVRTKLQSEKLSYHFIWKAIAATVRKEGLLSLWRGWGPTILRDVPFSCIYWFHYESFKTAILARYQTTELPVAWAFASGATAGTIAGVLTLPFDVVKTHRQIELGELLAVRQTLTARKTKTSTLALMTNLYRQRGVTALFSGVAPRIAKVAPSCAIMISSYEFFKSYFRKKNLGSAGPDVPSALYLQKSSVTSTGDVPDKEPDKKG